MATKLLLMDESIESWKGLHEASCPYLPAIDRPLSAEWTRAHRGRRGADFYLATLEYGQSLWMMGKPAQAILQLNRAWSADLEGSEPVLKAWPLPYRALVWMLRHAPDEGFLGNPVRHFQHLATRVRGEGSDRRSWRAWSCYLLSRRVLPENEFPPDHQQIEKESLILPVEPEVTESLKKWGIPGEAALFEEVLRSAAK